MSTPAQRPTKKTFSALIVGLVLLAVGGLVVGFRHLPCSLARDCYLLLKRVQSGQTGADQRRRVLLENFGASADKIAFSVLMSDNRSVGLVVADRHNGVSRVISETGAHFGNPYFSRDGRRLLLVRALHGRPYRDLLSCRVATWRCEVVVRTSDSIMFPVEVDTDTILYASSPMRTAPDGRKLYNRYDLYVARRDVAPKRLTEFGLYEIGWLGLGSGKLVFGADGHNPRVLPPRKLGRTDIFALKFDWRRLEILPKTLPLTPIFQMDTLSIRPAISPDGQRVAFLKVTSVRGKYRYDMAVATMAGTVEHSIQPDGIALSHGVFVGGTLLVNELFKDHYRVRMLDLARGTVDAVLTLDHSPAALVRLEPIRLKVDDGERSAQRMLPASPN
jgi:hypothetical protein